MKCPYCGNSDSRVLETRESGEESVTRRRRECTDCGERYTTYERVEIKMQVEKSDGSLEPFNRDKLRSGIEKACKKRPVPDEDIERIVGEVESSLLSRKGGSVNSKEIGDIVVEKLKEIDQVAYIRFASIYRSFEDVDAFEEEVQTLRGS